jgi:hypothetical protein
MADSDGPDHRIYLPKRFFGGKSMPRSVRLGLAHLAAVLLAFGMSGAAVAAGRFQVSFPSSLRSEALTGRLLVIVSPTATPEPRMAMGPNGPPMFGVDIQNLKPGAAAVVDDTAVSYPIEKLDQLEPGDYWVQALVSKYDLVHRADGHAIWVPTELRRTTPTMLPGNLYSTPVKVHLDPAQGFDVKLELSQTIKDEPLADSEWVKRFRIKSEILSKFWGFPIYLSGNVLLPKGWAEHPKAHYPIALLNSFDTEPFFIKTDPSSRAGDQDLVTNNNLQTGYDFYQSWISDGFPRFLAVTLEEECPFFMEAYAVDSANCGPYGEALTKELIPALEARYRAIGKPYARFVEGASTGGWETLNLQLKYPDYFGGAWVFNPDPIDFHHYQQTNAYKDANAFEVPMSKWVSEERPFRRTTEGQVNLTMRQLSRMEEVLGTHGRSGFQLEGWEAIYSPVGPDGYPTPLWDKLTGKIDNQVAEAMRAGGYDLTDYARRNWTTLGPKLRGKLNVISGEMDNFYLNLAVYDFQAMIHETAGPDYPARFVFGRPKKGHSWHHKNWDGVVREMAAWAKSQAPAGEDIAQWNY